MLISNSIIRDTKKLGNRNIYLVADIYKVSEFDNT